MADPRTFAEAEHQDAAGWALGLLDADDRRRFVVHPHSCPECQQAVADFRSAALILKTPYECWYAGPGSRPGHPDLITAGTFTVGPSGTATVQMWSAADPRTFPTMQITAEQAGDAGQHGQVILTGTTRK